MASTVGAGEDFVVEDGEVEGETKTDGVRGSKVGLRNLGGGLVGVERLVGRGLALVANGELGEVAVVVTLPVMATILAFVRDEHAGLTHILW